MTYIKKDKKLKPGPKINPDKYLIVKCSGCGISFTTYKCRYKTAQSKTFYHDKNCFIKNNDKFKGNPNKKSIYLDHYRCRTCCKFIPKSEARMHTTSKGLSYPVCSDINCGNYHLQTKPRHKKIYHKRMQELKLITVAN